VRLLALYFLDKLCLGFELITLDFQLVQQLGALALLFLYLVGGSFELSGQEGHIAFVVVICVLLIINLPQTLDQLVGLVLRAELFLFWGSFFASLKLVDFSLEFILFICKLFLPLIPQMSNPLKFLLLLFEYQLPLLALSVMVVLYLFEGLFEQINLLLSELLHFQATGHELLVVGLLGGEELGCELLELVLEEVCAGEGLGFGGGEGVGEEFNLLVLM
jgi:hypothetical protein